MPGNDHDFEDPQPEYSKYQQVGVGAERVTIIDIHELPEGMTERSYSVVYPDDGEDTLTETELDELAAQQGDYNTNWEGALSETTRDGFGNVEVQAKRSSITYSLAAQGASEHLDAFDARLIAHALRQAGPALELLIGDDPLEVADAFERAAESLKAYEEDLPDENQ